MVNFLDTNVFVRYIAGDDEIKTHACGAFFRRLTEGSEIAMTSEAIVAEVVFVLSSKRLYALPASEITARLRPLVSITSLRIQGKERVIRALAVYAERPFLGFEDALIVAHLEGSASAQVVSYDRHFDRVPGVQRIEPPPG
jgi:predicted nucleic acid-binding protein